MRCVVFLALAFSAACNSGSPSAPSPTPPQSQLAMSIPALTGSQTPTGYSYTVEVRVQNTGSVPATLTSLTLTFAGNGPTLGTVTVPSAFGGKVQANSSIDSRVIILADDAATHAFATGVTATVSFTDDVAVSGTLNATRSIGALPSDVVSVRYDDVSREQDPVCQNFEPATRLPCKIYLVTLHEAGELNAVLNWDDRIEYASALALELVREPGTGAGDQIALNYVTQGNPNREEVIAILQPGLYSVRVLYQRDLGPQPFVLTMTHPR